MSITSTSTLAEVLADYNDSLNWEGNVTLARQNLAAVRWLMINRPTANNAYGQGFTFDISTLIQQEKALKSYIDTQSSSGKSLFTRGRLSYE